MWATPIKAPTPRVNHLNTDGLFLLLVSDIRSGIKKDPIKGLVST